MFSKHKPLFLMMMLAVVTFVARPAAAAQAPEKSVADDTMLMLWLDLTQIDGETIIAVSEALGDFADSDMLKQNGIGVPLGDTEQGMADLIETRDAMVANGARGMLLMIDRAAEDSWSPNMRMLVQTTEDADAAKLAELAAGMTDGAATAEATPYAEGWHTLTLISTEGDGEAISLPVVTDGDEEIAAAFNLQLDEQKDAPFALVFRMDDSIRTMIDDMAINAEDPQVAMMMSMVQLLSGMDTMALSIADEEGMVINLAMRFQDEQQSTQFLQMYNAIMMMAPALLAQQAQELDDAPEPAVINGFFGKLLMQPDGQTLRLRLDQDFFDLAQEMGAMLEGMGLNGGGLDLDL